MYIYIYTLHTARETKNGNQIIVQEIFGVKHLTSSTSQHRNFQVLQFSIQFCEYKHGTPPKTNIDTQNDALENASPFKHGYFGYLS